MAQHLLFAVALGAYLVASVGFHAHLFTGNEGARRLAGIVNAVGAAAHFAGIGVWCTRHTGIFTDPAMPFVVLSWFLAVAQVLAGLRPRWAALGSVTSPLAFFSLFYALLLMPGSAAHPASATGWLNPHVMVLLLGFCAFALSFCLAVFYQIEARLLKSKQLSGLLTRLPPLDAVARGAHWMAALGFSLLTLGVVTGALAAAERWGGDWYLQPRFLSSVVTSLVAWVIYAAYLGVSLGLGWRGRRTSWFLIAGFAVVLVAYMASIGQNKSAALPGPGPARAVRAPVPSP